MPAVVVAFAVLAAACGDGAATTTQASTTAGPTSTMAGMENAMMNMGDPDATPAGDLMGAELVSGDFRALGSAPDGFEDVAGSAALARHAAGTTVTIELQNLIPGKDYIAHVHAGTCFDAGGPHYKFDGAGSDMPPNEIHLALTGDSDGTGFMTAENHRVAADTASSVVLYERAGGAPKIACADLS